MTTRTTLYKQNTAIRPVQADKTVGTPALNCRYLQTKVVDVDQTGPRYRGYARADLAKYTSRLNKGYDENDRIGRLIGKQGHFQRDEGIGQTIAHTMDKNANILIVEDSTTTRELIKKNLYALGFPNIKEAENGHTALDRLKNQKIDFLISDWELPGITGIDLVKKIRQDKAFCSLPVLMITTRSDSNQITEAFRAGVNEYIIKPITQEALKGKINRICRAMTTTN